MKIKYLVFVFALFLLACKVESQELETEKEDKYLDIVNGDSLMPKAVDENVIRLMLASVPSPFDNAMATKWNITTFETKNLCEIRNNYTTNNQKALALGVYSVNLAYINLYQLKDTAYLKEVKKLAKDLKIEHHIHFDSIAKFVYEDNFDNLLNETQRGYDRILDSSKTIEQNYENFLTLVGVFVEMNYQTLLSYKKLQENKADTTILNQWKERIGDQKFSLEQIMIVFSFFVPYDKEKHIQNDFKELEQIYKEVKITTKSEPLSKNLKEMIDKNSGCVFLELVQKDIITISDTTISKISEKTKEIRRKIVR